MKLPDAYYSQIDNEIGLNITKCWEYSDDENDFIKRFGVYYTHELLHRTIRELIGLYINPSVIEEKYIYEATGEGWDKTLNRYYKKIYR